ncbi:rhamnulokinase [Verrucomicrobiota bacterium sgz303538]
MSEKCFLAVDLGAESGRVLAGLWDGNRMRQEEIHRFPNGGVWFRGTMRWDTMRLWGEIERGLAMAAERFGPCVVSVGVDTWALDYVLLSKTQEVLGVPWHYRDSRTRGLLDHTIGRLSREEIYAASGVQFMEINSLYQLLALQRDHPEILAVADRFLMIPDYLHWLLCGSVVSEFTNATTTQFYHPTEKRWSYELLTKLNLPTHILPEVVQPGAKIGTLRKDVAGRSRLGQINVIAPATHDTGSAVVAVPAEDSSAENWAYLSSGTWSLLGLEIPTPDLSARACSLNMTNEGGVDGTYRLLKNIMGLWIIQRCRRSFESRGAALSYDGLMRRASEAPAFRSFIDPDDPRFLNPADMPEAIVEFCRETGQAVPETEGQFIRCALESLALKYAVVLGWLQEMTGRRIEVIHVVGGGARNCLLNQFTANSCNCRVLAGPVEATGLGNLLVQARSAGELGTLADMRAVSRREAGLQEYTPQESGAWAEARARFERLLKRS